MGQPIHELEKFVNQKLKDEWDKADCPILFPLLSADFTGEDLYIEPLIEFTGSTQSEIGKCGLIRMTGILDIKIVSKKGSGKQPINEREDEAITMFQRKAFIVAITNQVIFQDAIPQPLTELEDRAHLSVFIPFIYEYPGV
jgi:hypothetical protein